MLSQYNVITHPADNGGCGHYRMKFPAWAAQSLRKDISIVESPKLIHIPGFYQDVRMVRIQRQLADYSFKFVLEFLKPLSEKIGFWLSYEIDDVVGRHDIPRYNSGWQTFQNDKLMMNMKYILQLCDVVTVTTPELGNYYHRKFGVDKNNIIVIPNYLPRWWIGESYDLEKIKAKIQSEHKPRIGFISSSTHFDLFNRNDGVDDFTHIVDFIRDTVDKYRWVFIGGVPQQLKDLVEDKKIEFNPGFDILNYTRIVNSMKFDLMVAPLQDNVFNRCKSNIKFIEMAALGIPCIVQDLTPYKKYTDLRFTDANDLQDKIDFVLSNKERYLDLVKNNRDIIDNGDSNAPKGWWLENNMDVWFQQFCVNQRSLRFDLREINFEEITPENKNNAGEITFEV